MKFKLSNFLVLPLLGASCVYAADNIPTNPSPMHKGSIERAETKQATALLDRAVDYLQKNGPENSFGVFSNRQGPFVSNEYYVFVVGLDGVMYASGGASNSLVGSNVLNLSDASGINIIRDMLDIAKTSESGAIEYHWLNSVDNRIENTTTQFRKVGKYLVCVGYYIHRASLEEATVMLHRAVAFLKNLAARPHMQLSMIPQVVSSLKTSMFLPSVWMMASIAPPVQHHTLQERMCGS